MLSPNLVALGYYGRKATSHDQERRAVTVVRQRVSLALSPAFMSIANPLRNSVAQTSRSSGLAKVTTLAQRPRCLMDGGEGSGGSAPSATTSS